MFEQIGAALEWALGREAEELTVGQMSLRALLIFFAGLAMVRVGEKKDGEIRWDEMRTTNISKEDLLGALHEAGQVQDPEEVEIARLERTGEVSIIPDDPRRIEIAVEQGAQIIRIELP